MIGGSLVEIPLHAAPDAQSRAVGVITVGVDRDGATPAIEAERFDLLVTAAKSAARPWIGIEGDVEAQLSRLAANVCQRPLASGTLAQVLRVTEALPVPDALIVESLAYSTLLGGTEFSEWRRSRAIRSVKENTQPRVRFTREADAVCIHLANPARLNAFDARMRDDLVEALCAVIDDPSVTSLALRGDGRAFSSGGDLDEFGSTPDLATAHAIRTLRSPALLVHQLRELTTAYLHGACIGAGIEVPAASSRVVAQPGSSFRLPEIGMGLIPGAGGTVTIPRRIGRHRTLYWALADQTIDVGVALDWGLIDAVGEPA
jgi:enoyl-CoA hydratase/carnithine racemase